MTEEELRKFLTERKIELSRIENILEPASLSSVKEFYKKHHKLILGDPKAEEIGRAIRADVATEIRTNVSGGMTWKTAKFLLDSDRS